MTVEAIRRALGAGAHAVGARLDAAFPAGARPWFLTDGVVHVGVHSDVTLGSVWGACFAVDRDFARAAGIQFQPDLGRRRRRLESGDDSTFIRQLRECGGVVVFLPGAPAVHTVRPVLRRAWWQGRSEVRRDDWRAGLTKEIRRSWQGASTLAERSVATSCNIAVVAVVAGIAAELAMRWCTTSRCRAGAEPR